MRINAKTEAPITIEDHVIEDVDDFVYLRATVNKEGGVEEET